MRLRSWRRTQENADLPEDAREFAVERYKYILQQVHATNENVYRFLAIYQTLAIGIATAGLALFVGYRGWRIDPVVARSGLIALMWLETVVAAFTVMLILIGVVSWLDYRKEECELTDEYVRPGFRRPPRKTAFIRWYETYIVLFIVATTVFMWIATLTILLPGIV
ncbi:hypothetical protein [Nonomuraea gerenzanensis]|uniref:hypothetical protein n=1 Tax=Nonomuraea gerenzanensis TaxID=93944 RepID=UPI001CD9F524|nr:hypothetical protein [Nonomuraea gerenzanensis]UBU14643.1 hypothetical protein LCN96_06345 [Nonomuraea gerenzanensis]